MTATNGELYPIAQEALQRSIRTIVDPHPNANDTHADRVRAAHNMAATAGRLRRR